MIERLTLPSRLDSSAAPALMRGLLAQRGRPLQIDASEVDVAGARALEVIIAAGRQWSEDGQELTLAQPSEHFRATCAVLGLDPAAPWRAPDDTGKAGRA